MPIQVDMRRGVTNQESGWEQDRITDGFEDNVQV